MGSLILLSIIYTKTKGRVTFSDHDHVRGPLRTCGLHQATLYHFVHLAIYHFEVCVRLSSQGLAGRSVGTGVYAVTHSISSSQVVLTLRENRGILYQQPSQTLSGLQRNRRGHFL